MICLQIGNMITAFLMSDMLSLYVEREGTPSLLINPSFSHWNGIYKLVIAPLFDHWCTKNMKTFTKKVNIQTKVSLKPPFLATSLNHPPKAQKHSDPSPGNQKKVPGTYLPGSRLWDMHLQDPKLYNSTKASMGFRFVFGMAGAWWHFLTTKKPLGELEKNWGKKVNWLD